jgi:putative flippase GtrA
MSSSGLPMTTDAARLTRSTRLAALRFLMLGGSNTAITLVLFAVLARIMRPSFAYTVVFALGLAYTTALTGRFVFGARTTRRSSLLFSGWYLLVYAVGLGVVQTLQIVGVHSPDLLALLTVVVTAPLNFLGGRWIFRARSSTSQKELVP